MSKLPVLKPAELVRLLERLGFQRIRQKGSHLYLRHPDGRATVVPIHRGEDIPPGLLRAILHDTELTREQFLDLLS
ncbi:MAG: type II toxin-antitoxin system HicA family toxin [Candidatus Omnitrophica bacterium]|nr:type II toxin-antitoxin system HicA family toxin [Candidatus Omnitrophota bacterium]